MALAAYDQKPTAPRMAAVSHVKDTYDKVDALCEALEQLSAKCFGVQPTSAPSRDSAGYDPNISLGLFANMNIKSVQLNERIDNAMAIISNINCEL